MALTQLRCRPKHPPTRLPVFWSCCLTASIDAPCRLGESSCALVGARSRRRPIDHRSRKQHQHSPRVLAARSPPLGSYQHREATDSFPRVAPVPRSEGAPSYPPPPGNGAGAGSTRCSTTEADQAAIFRSCATSQSTHTASSLQCTFSSTRKPQSGPATQSPTAIHGSALATQLPLEAEIFTANARGRGVSIPAWT